MGARTELPRTVRRIDHTWIPMSDGTRLRRPHLAPEDAAEDPTPAILEYIPYRKGEGDGWRETLPGAPRAAEGRAARPSFQRDGLGAEEAVLTPLCIPT